MTPWFTGISIVAGIAFFIYIAVRMTSLKHQKAIDSFKAGAHQTNEDYLKELGIAPGTRQAEIVIWLRRFIAESGGIPTESVRLEHRIWKDYD